MNTLLAENLGLESLVWFPWLGFFIALFNPFKNLGTVHRSVQGIICLPWALINTMAYGVMVLG